MSGNEISGQSIIPWRHTMQLLSMGIAQILLPGVLYGMFTLLTLACFCILSTSDRQGRTAKLLLGLTLFALWASTTAFMVLNTFFSQYLILREAYITWSSDSQTNAGYDDDEVLKYLHAGVCGGTATLTVNILLGDAIVWWRACVLWRGNWPIRVLCVLLLVATFAMGIVDTCWACYRGDTWRPRATGIGYMYQGFSYGVAATALSLATNVLATALVAHKSWRYRAMLRKYIEVGTTASRLEKLMVLLVESGVAYCLLWIVVAILLSGLNDQDVVDNAQVLRLDSFWETFAVFLQGGLVPVIAIYPTIIIVLVALDKSQVEKQFWRSANVRHGRIATILPVEDDSKGSIDGPRSFPLSARNHTAAPLLAVNEE